MEQIDSDAIHAITQAEADRMRPMVAHVLEGEPMPSVIPTPSITVGTQVRLTGVVTERNPVGEIRIDLGKHFVVWIPENHEAIEVIRQPFKRGEVVWSCGAVATGIAYQVLADEAPSGDVLLIKESEEGGNRSFVAHHSDFERRP